MALKGRTACPEALLEKFAFIRHRLGEGEEHVFVLRSRIEHEDELDEVLESTAWDHYARVWLSLAGGFEAGEDPAGAERCRARARDLSPWLVEQ